MRDENKSKEQLLNELKELRHLYAEQGGLKTEHTGTRESLRGNGEPFNSLIQSASDAIYSIDAAGVRLPPTFSSQQDWSGIDDPQKRVFIDCLETCRNLVPPGNERAECNANCLLEFPQECEEIPVRECYPPHSGLITAYTGEYEQEELNGMYLLAEETGGKMYWGTNNLNESLDQAFDKVRVSDHHLTTETGL